MSDHWSHYVADMGGYTASIVFDDGIAETIRALPETVSILATIELLEMNDSSMPTDAEAKRLEVLQDALDKAVSELGGYSVGRVTSNGKRHHFFYVSEMTNEMTTVLSETCFLTGYETRVASRNDPEKLAYFENLYPDAESRQVIMDMNVISQLLEHGDDISIPRKIDHLSIFETKSSAKSYEVWARSAGYEVSSFYSKGLLKKKYCVETHNMTAVTVYAVNAHSLGHFRKAKELGGVYDGWGCSVVSSI